MTSGTPEERAEIIANEAKARHPSAAPREGETYFGQAQKEALKHPIENPPPSLSYPRIPAGPWSGDPVPAEPPLGFRIRRSGGDGRSARGSAVAEASAGAAMTSKFSADYATLKGRSAPQLRRAAAKVRGEIGKLVQDAIDGSARSRTPAGRLFPHLSSGGKPTADQVRGAVSPLGGQAK